MQTTAQPSDVASPTGEGRPFSNSLEHILAELERIDLLIQSSVQRARRLATSDPNFQGLCIQEQEVDALLKTPCGLPSWTVGAPEAKAHHDVLVGLRQAIDERKAQSRAAGILLRLDHLRRLFGLDDIAADILLICLAPEMDLRYEKLYAYLQDDVTKKRPSVDLILNLLARNYAEKIKTRSRFLEGSPPVEFKLIELFVEPSQPEPPLLRKYCRLDPRIVAFLLGQDIVDDRLRDLILVRPANVNLRDTLLPAALKEQCSSFLQYLRKDNAQAVLYLQAPPGSGKHNTAQALCRNISAVLLEVDVRRLLQRSQSEFRTYVQLSIRESWLRRASVYWKGFDALLAPERVEEREFLLEQIERWLGLTFLGGEAAWDPGEGQLRQVRFVRLELPELEYAERQALWERLLPQDQLSEDADLSDVSNRFRLSVGSITSAAATAHHLARWRMPEMPLISGADLQASCRLHSNQRLGTLARKIDPKHTLADIVLPPDQLAQLNEILAQARHRHIVYGEWGFSRKLSSGKGLNVLFSGPPGTGKTMAAQVLASELNLDVYQIDLSQVVSKYIGETEKNLNQIFREAHGSNAILFFDEADALFGKRSETKDAHDRYANIEVGYLLQKMEEYEGIAILATNLRNNLDDAFIRRLHVIIDFPFPDEEHRRRLWEIAFPRETPLGAEVDFGTLARDIRLAGGNIKNIALAAAFYAASNGKLIHMPHLMLAARREHEKLGRNWVEPEQPPVFSTRN